MYMDKSIRMSLLLEVYRNVLTERQADVVDLYYNQNLSLSEIAEDLKVTRQAVRKSIIEAEKNLVTFEEKLNIFEKQTKRQEIIDEILKTVKDKKVVKLIEELRML